MFYPNKKVSVIFQARTSLTIFFFLQVLFPAVIELQLPRGRVTPLSMGVQQRSKQAYSRVKLCDKGGSSSLKDRISWLPDDILVLILSFLTVEEAAASSILSTRWHQVWKLVSRLDFYGMKATCKMNLPFDQVRVERPKYVEWVTQVLRLNKCFSLDELKIRFSLTNEFSQAIDEWIDVAITKRVPKLELNLSAMDGHDSRFCFQTYIYTFPSRLLPSTLDRRGVLPFKFLESLYLSYVAVTGDDLHYFLNHCPVLERLSLHDSTYVGSLHVVGFAIPLKYLEIAECVNVEVIEIRNTNLISFSYSGPKIKLLVANVPHLVELSYKGAYVECLRDFLNQVSCCLPQLRALTFSFFASLMRISKFGAHPRFVHLNELVLNISVRREDESLLGYVFLIEASPHLERFVLKLQWATHPTINGGEARSSVEFSHKYLKVVEMAGYYGGTSDFELAMYFIENAVALEKVVIDPRSQFSRLIRSPESTKCAVLAGRSRAYQQLHKKVPSEVELVIL